MTRITCPSCQIARINGVICHESGCHDSHLFIARECRECGTRFAPESRRQVDCSPCCTAAYYGHSCYCNSCREVAR